MNEVSRRKRILFICTGNTCRSQMAEAIVKARRGDEWDAFSAGTHPGSAPDPRALQALAEIGIETKGSEPTHIDDFDGERFNLTVTLCDEAVETCPVWRGQGKRVHIGFPDPYRAGGTNVMAAYREVRDAIEETILALVDKR